MSGAERTRRYRERLRRKGGFVVTPPSQRHGDGDVTPSRNVTFADSGYAKHPLPSVTNRHSDDRLSEGAERGLSRGLDKFGDWVLGGLSPSARPTQRAPEPPPETPAERHNTAIPRRRVQAGELALEPVDWGDERAGNTGDSLDGLTGGDSAPFQSVTSKTRHWGLP
jgi:hypothetical protein